MQQCEETQINSVMVIYKMLCTNVKQLESRQYTREDFDKENVSNIPVEAWSIDHESDKSLKFRTVRKNKTHQFDIFVQKFEPRFYEDEGSEEYCLEIFSHTKLVNPEKFQQEFSIFLASERHLIDFIFETVWLHIDEYARKKEEEAHQKIQREKISREQNTRYFFRGQKNDEEPDRMVELSREDRYKNRCLRINNCIVNTR